MYHSMQTSWSSKEQKLLMPTKSNAKAELSEHSCSFHFSLWLGSTCSREIKIESGNLSALLPRKRLALTATSESTKWQVRC
mmetsp:Transcript_36679/g.88381  ORF Transcript_36679/g.88381 Transcript_36679/m.88381 type:complete len:81 (+) Transcript_36679:85-327(+)